MLGRPGRDLGTARKPELLEGVADVGLNRALADEERRRDLPVRHPAGDQDRDLPLPRGQRIVRLARARCPRGFWESGGCHRQIPVTAGARGDRLGQVLDRGAGLGGF